MESRAVDSRISQHLCAVSLSKYRWILKGGQVGHLGRYLGRAHYWAMFSCWRELRGLGKLPWRDGPWHERVSTQALHTLIRIATSFTACICREGTKNVYIQQAFRFSSSLV